MHSLTCCLANSLSADRQSGDVMTHDGLSMIRDPDPTMMNLRFCAESPLMAIVISCGQSAPLWFSLPLLLRFMLFDKLKLEIKMVSYRANNVTLGARTAKNKTESVQIEYRSDCLNLVSCRFLTNTAILAPV